MPAPKRAEQLGWIIDQLTLAAVAKGQAYTPERLRINAGDLIDVPQDALTLAFARVRKDLDYLPQVSEIRRFALADEGGRLDGEMRAAWDVLIRFVGRYVDCNMYGIFGPEFGWHPRSYPKLSDRILDVVRRTGGWKVYKCMTDADFPFVQKRFFEEYASWVAVEQVASGKLLTERPRLRLIAKSMDIPKTEMQTEPTEQQVAIKKVPEPLTEAQLRDRREMLRQQAESWSKRPR